ncbi:MULTISPECIES: acyl-CoA thioesterase II [Aurantimonas]|uniref:Acyl-CoA thioesterase 2 n=1 Tax=Aurantimonas coralicida TaxID=182270 RepID=A0A0N7KXC2_9HYPH|nr:MULTISPECIES: acyl-CoA thioesterase II [Aurantimonas]MAP18000.1 acyl-CoA thioesterase II [Aurantimonas sp.]MBC6717362.1 acyl-CoA thioesterase II [Aurantimonas sp. DM33-3]MCD1644659.1 acyl-CoA thioesterase II [Aurantimonas coralicida]BAT26513.1 acyl-CoA thioesterase II [Aurantimonas coralicida]
MTEAVEKLLETLDLERIEENLFRGTSPDQSWQRVFGGQVIAQALVAAQRTVPADRFCHSLHSYFMRPGDPATPIIYDVDRIRDGGSFTTRRVVAIQHGHAIFSLSASFQKDEEGLDHQATMPDVPGPDEVPHGEDLNQTILKRAPEAVRRYWERPRPIEFRPISFDHYLTTDKLEPVQRVWVRCPGEIGDDRALNAAVLAYLSDMTLLDTSLFAHGLSVFDKRIQAASLDHAMWFHRPVRVSDWLLYAQDSPSSSGARGLTRGSLYSADGVLTASVAQEGLIRPRRGA